MGPLTLSLDFPRMASDSVEDLGIFLIVCRGRFQGYKQLSTGLSKSNACLCPAPGLQSKAQIPRFVFPKRARRRGGSRVNVRTGGAARKGSGEGSGRGGFIGRGTWVVAWSTNLCLPMAVSCAPKRDMKSESQMDMSKRQVEGEQARGVVRTVRGLVECLCALVNARCRPLSMRRLRGGRVYVSKKQALLPCRNPRGQQMGRA